MTCILQAA